MTVHAACGSSVERGSPYLAWRPLFASLLGTGDRVPSDAEIERILEPLGPEARDRGALLGAVLPRALAETDETRWMTPEARHENTQRMLLQLLEMHRGPGSLVVAMDDVQWLDSASWSLLVRLVHGVDRALVLVAARDDVPDRLSDLGSLLNAAHSQSIDLQGLGRDDSLELVRRALGAETLPDAVARFVAERGEGHPFFSLELAYALRDAGWLEIRDGHGRLKLGADLDRIGFPESIEGVIAMRLDRLPAEAQSVLKVASVLGASFSEPALVELFGPAVPDGLGQRLDELVALDLLSAEDGLLDRYGFRHALIRDAVYGRLLYAQRRQLHRRAAAYFEHRVTASGAAAGPIPHGLLAHHWDEAGVASRAVDHLELAGDEALRDGAFMESAAFLGRALELADMPVPSPVADDPPLVAPPLRRANWRWLAAQANYRLGALDRSRDLAEASLAVLDQRVPRDGLRLGTAVLREVGIQLLHRLMPGRTLDRAPASQRERLQRAVRAYLNLAEVYYLASLKGRSAYAALRALNVAERAGPSLVLVETYGATCIVSGLVGRQSLAERYGRLGQEAAQKVGQPYATAINLHQVCLFRSGTGPAEPLFRDYERAVELFRSLGDKGRFRDCVGLAGIAAHLFGRLDEGELLLTELLETHQDGERSLPWTWGVTWLAAIALRRGRTEDALEGLRRAAASQVSEGLDMTSITIHGLLALALLRAGMPAEARAEADRTRAMIAMGGGRPTGHPVLDGYAALAEVSVANWDSADSAVERDRWRLATEQSCRYLGAYRRVFPIGEPAFRLYEGELAIRLGQRQRAATAWQQSLAAAQAIDMRHDLALAHLAVGADLRREDPEGAGHIAAAVEGFRQMGVSEGAYEASPLWRRLV
jgi:tetratricopeptide (TPR) repeat protein